MFEILLDVDIYIYIFKQEYRWPDYEHRESFKNKFSNINLMIIIFIEHLEHKHNLLEPFCHKFIFIVVLTAFMTTMIKIFMVISPLPFTKTCQSVFGSAHQTLIITFITWSFYIIRKTFMLLFTGESHGKASSTESFFFLYHSLSWVQCHIWEYFQGIDEINHNKHSPNSVREHYENHLQNENK